MTDHRPFDDDMLARLGDYLDGTLPDEERQALEARLADDPDLAAELAAFRQVDNLVRDAAPEVPEIDWGQFTRDARTRRESAGATPARSGTLRILRPMAAAAALTLIVSGAVWWQMTGEQDPVSPAIEVSVQRVTLTSSTTSASVSRELPSDALMTSGPAPRGRTLVVTVSVDTEDEDERRDDWEEDAALF
jgi:anti-sigma factor RsiW